MQHMKRALELAEEVRFQTSPRPWVGCVIVDTEVNAYEGATQGKSGPHAEAVALQKAGKRAAGATLYSTLEPCSHEGQTPPCTDAIISAGIAKVVAGIQDPDPKVSGKGFQALEAAGIEVSVGHMAEEVRAQLAPYITHRKLGRPYITLKMATTLDGRTAMPDASSQWITSEAARADAHQLRAEHDAILVGAGTARQDNPRLTVRTAELPEHLQDRQPTKFVLGDIPAGSNLTSSDVSPPAELLKGDLPEILSDLGNRGIMTLLVEGGATVAAAFHEANLIDRYVLYIAPSFAKGTDGKPILATETAQNISEIWRGKIASLRQVGDDIRVEVFPK